MSRLGRMGLLALGLVLLIAPAAAGQGRAGCAWPARDGGFGMRGPMGPNLGRVITVAMENRADLALTDDQMAELQVLLDEFEGVAEAAAESREKSREELRSGDLTREEMRERRSAESAAFREVAQQYHERFDGILSQAQRDQVRGIMVRTMTDGRGAARGGNRPGRPGAGRGTGR